MTTQDVVDRLNNSKQVRKVKLRIVQRWAAGNGVAYTGEGRRKDFIFTEADYERFLNREKPGRRWEKE